MLGTRIQRRAAAERPHYPRAQMACASPSSQDDVEGVTAEDGAIGPWAVHQVTTQPSAHVFHFVKPFCAHFEMHVNLSAAGLPQGVWEPPCLYVSLMFMLLLSVFEKFVSHYLQWMQLKDLNFGQYLRESTAASMLAGAMHGCKTPQHVVSSPSSSEYACANVPIVMSEAVAVVAGRRRVYKGPLLGSTFVAPLRSPSAS